MAILKEDIYLESLKTHQIISNRPTDNFKKEDKHILAKEKIAFKLKEDFKKLKKQYTIFFNNKLFLKMCTGIGLNEEYIFFHRKNHSSTTIKRSELKNYKINKKKRIVFINR